MQQSDALRLVEDFLSTARENQTRRTSQFSRYESFILDGNQWEQDRVPLDGDPQFILNRSEDYINTYLAKLFPKNQETGALEIGVAALIKDKDKKEKFEAEVQSTYLVNDLPTVLLEQGQNFLVGGDACLYYPKDPVTKRAKIISLNPTSVFLGWNGGRLEQFAFEDEVSLVDAEVNKRDNWLIEAIKTFLRINNTPSDRFKKVKRVTYWDDAVQIVKIDNVCEVRKNDDGFIPFSWIPNKPKSHSKEGRSEGRSLFEMDQEVSYRMADFGKRVKDNTDAVLALYTDLNAAKVDREKLRDGLLALAKGDKAEYLKLDENKEVLDYITELHNRMDSKMGINDAVNGMIKSNVSSLAMAYYFSPLLDRIGLKRVAWDTAFRELNRAILKYAFPDSLESERVTNPVYAPILPTDNDTKIANIILLLQNRLISHVEAIDALRGGKNSIQTLDEIKKEFGELSKIAGFLQIKNVAQKAGA